MSGTHRITSWLLARHPPLWRQVPAYTLVAMVAAALFIMLAYGVVLAFGGKPELLSRGTPDVSLSGIFGTVVFAPVTETLLLAVLLWLLRKASSKRLFVAVVSGLVWGAAHAALGVFSFFGTTPEFFVFSCAYMAWREVSFGRAFLAAATPHALINSLALALVAVT